MAKIYTVIPYYDDEVFPNDINSFYKLEDAQEYGYSLSMRYDIVGNQLN
jgi:hypothetical protein